MGRPLKRDKTKHERLIKGYVKRSKGLGNALPKDEDDSRIWRALNSLKKFFLLVDYVYNSNYCEIINTVYLNYDNYCKTRENIARSLFTTSSTLMHKTNNIIKCFAKLFEMDENKSNKDNEYQ